LPGTERLRTTLPIEIASMVREKVASGEFRSESDFFEQSDLLLQMESSDLAMWLQTEAPDAIAEMDANPHSLLTPEEVGASLKEEFRSLSSGERKRYTVRYSPRSLRQLKELAGWLSRSIPMEQAERYLVDTLQAWDDRKTLPERGTLMPELGPNVRTEALRRRAMIVFECGKVPLR